MQSRRKHLQPGASIRSYHARVRDIAANTRCDARNVVRELKYDFPGARESHLMRVSSLVVCSRIVMIDGAGRIDAGRVVLDMLDMLDMLDA